MAEGAGRRGALEIRAFHLDRATALLAELDGSAPVELQREAAEALTEAGLRAFAREANRSARQLLVRAVELEPTLRRRYLAARAADRLSDLPAVSREMEEVLAAAIDAGDRWTQGRALVTLAEAVVLRDADVVAAEEMIDRALDVLEPEDLTGRFRALRASATIAWTSGDLAKEERVMQEAISLARQAGRKDFESEAADELASVYLARLELDRAQPLIEQAILLAEESGSAEARGRALRFAGQLHLYRRELDDAEAALASARDYLAEAGAAWALGRTLNFSAWTARHKGDLPKSERLYRESIRILAPLEDRVTLCEASAAWPSFCCSRVASTKPSASRSPPGRPSVRMTSPRSRRRPCRLGSCARRRAATRRPSSCCERRTSRSRRASTGCTRWVPSRRWLSSCATAAARTRPPSSTSAARLFWTTRPTPLGSPDPTPGRATPRSPSPDA